MRPLVLVILLCTFLSSGDGQVKNQDSATADAHDYSKEAYVIEKAYYRIRMEDDGTGTQEREVVLKILADAGVKAFAVLNFTYTSANETVDVDYVRVRKPDGTVVKTPDYNVQDMPGDVTRTAPMYSDIHEKHVAVKGLAVGDTVEYLLRYRITKPEIPGHFWYETTFIKDAIVKDERLELNVPASKYVKVSSPDVKPEIREENGRRIYSWKHANLEPKQDEDRARPKRTQPPPSVQITTFHTWDEVGNWYNGLQRQSLEVTPALKAKAAELTKDLKTDDEKIRAIYEFVSLNFHYIGLDFGIGRYQPHPADDVLGNGYGDCKDKHTLLAALLKAAGYDTWPALIHASRKLDPEVPSPAQFNHVISVVPLGEKLVWLDTTPEVAPYRLLLITLRDHQALVIPPDKPPVLMRTPADPPTPQKQTFRMVGKLGSDGTFTGHAEESYEGEAEIIFRSLYRQAPESEWKQVTQRLSYGMGFGGDVSNVNVSAPGAMDKPFQISYDYLRKKYSGWEDRQMTPPVPPMGVEHSKDDKKPGESILLGSPGTVEYEAKLTLPPGYTVVAPKSLDLTRPYAEYHATANVQDGVLTSKRRLVIKQREVALEQWEDYRDFGSAVSDDEFKVIHLDGNDAGVSGAKPKNLEDLDDKFRAGYEAMQKRDVSRAEELFRQVIAGNSSYKNAHLNLGLALATRGEVSEALEEFRREQEVNPEETRAYMAAATFLMMRNQRDQAIGEWQKLLKVDPSNHDAALNASGLLSAEGKDKEAVSILEKAVETSPGSAQLEMALGQAYVQSGEVDKGIPHMRKAVEATSDINPMLLNNAAYVLAEKKTRLDVAKEFAEKAIAALDVRSAQIPEPDSTSARMAGQFAAVWDTVGWVYFESGDAQKAESFVRAAWKLDQQALEGDHLGQIYEKLGKKTEAARIYEQALDAHLAPMIAIGNSGPDLGETYKKTRDDILSRYTKLTGRKEKPMSEIHRLPNGEWTKTPFEELASEREVKISSKNGGAAVADFALAISPEKVNRVRFVRGDEKLKSMIDILQSIHYPQYFPAGSKAMIVRQLHVTCHPNAECSGELQLPGEVTP